MANTDVKSDIAGKVWRIDAQIGQALDEDDAILTLESMKMEIPVVAPIAGTLAELLVGEGDAIGEGQVVARLQE